MIREQGTDPSVQRENGSEKKLSDAEFKNELARIASDVEKFCVRMMKNHQSAKDISQQALAKAWKKRNQFRGESTLYTWVCKIALNEKGMFYRGTQDGPNGYLNERLDSKDYHGLVSDEDSEQKVINKQIVEMVLENLPEYQKRLIVLSYFDGMTNQEIAEKENRTVQAIKNELHRIRVGMLELYKQKLAKGKLKDSPDKT